MSKRLQILVCDGPSCGLCFDSEELAEHMRARIAATEGLEGRVFVSNLTCFGRCNEGPNMLVRDLEDGESGELEPDYERLDRVLGLYVGVNQELVDRVLDEHCCVDGQPIASHVERY